MASAWITLIIFLLCYALFVFLPTKRSWVSCIGASLVILLSKTELKEAFFSHINWNVMGLFVGTLVLAELFMMSRMPAVMAEWLVDKTGTVRGAMITVCVFAGFISMFVENVAVVLLVSPVALSLADKFKISPLKLLLLVAMSSNIQGTATMIGDPPSMILAGYMKMGFNDFFFYKDHFSIFFAVEIGALSSLAIMFFVLRKLKHKIELLQVEKIKSLVPSFILIVFVIGLSVSSVFDPDFKWFAGVFTMIMAIIAFIWYRAFAKWGSVRNLLRTLDWDTTFFLIGIFIIVGALSNSGWLDKIAKGVLAITGTNIIFAYVFFVFIAMVISGFVDNVPFLLVMLPVVSKVAATMAVPAELFVFGLLCGTCMGGNLTPIGASANVVTMGMLRKRGYVVSFKEYMLIGVPITLASTICSAAFIWCIWK